MKGSKGVGNKFKLTPSIVGVVNEFNSTATYDAINSAWRGLGDCCATSTE